MDRIEYLKTTKYPDVNPTVIDMAVSSDPTPEKKFTDWIVRMMTKSGLQQHQLKDVTSILSTYNSIRNRMPAEKRDVNRFSTPLELSVSVMEFMREDSQPKSSDPLMIYDKIHESERWLVIRPHTYEASMKYGKSTKWCTTVRATFYSYMSSGFLYILIDKTLPDGDAEAKLQFHFAQHGAQYMDALNHGIQILDFFSNNKSIWEAFVKTKEFENSNCKFLKLIHDNESMNSEAQLSGYKWFGFQVFDILKNPCPSLQKKAIETIVSQKQNWTDLRRIGKLTFEIQKDLIDIAIEHGKNNNIVQQAYSELSRIENEISEDVKIKFIKHCPESLSFINEPSDEVVEIALLSHPDLIKRKIQEYKNGLVKRKWFAKMAIKIPDILEFFGKSIELSVEEAEKIINSKNFSIPEHIRYIKIIPERIQLSILRKHGVDYYKYFKNPTDKVKTTYQKLKKRFDAKEKLEKKRMEKQWGSSSTPNQMIRIGNGYIMQCRNGAWMRSDGYNYTDNELEVVKAIVAATTAGSQIYFDDRYKMSTWDEDYNK